MGSPMNFSPISANTSPLRLSNGYSGGPNGFPYFHEPGMSSSSIQNLITSPASLMPSPNLNPISPFPGGCGPLNTSTMSPFSYFNHNQQHHGHGTSNKSDGHQNQSLNQSLNGHYNLNGSISGNNFGFASPAAAIPTTSIASGNNLWMGQQSNYLPCYLTGEISPGKKEILNGLYSISNNSGGSGSNSSGQKKSPSPTNLSPNGNPRDSSFLFQTPQSLNQKPNFVRRVTFDEGSNETTPKGPPKTGMGYLQNDESPPSVFLEASANAGNRLNSSTGFTPINETTRSTRNVVNATSQWVTIFGFASAATSFVITTFSSVGTIVETRANPGSNWIHIKFSSKIEARKALAKNGTILAGTTMIGVVQCQDPDLNFGSEVNDSIFNIGSAHNSSHNIFSSPESKNHITNSANPSNRNILGELSTRNSQFNSPSSSSANNKYFDQNGHLNGSINHNNLKSKIRPLANGNSKELNFENVPRESTGFFTNILEYMFGW